MPDNVPYKITSTGKLVHNLEQTKRLTVPPEPPEDEYVAGKGCVCGAYGQCECGCGVDWTDPEVYKLRDMLVETTIDLSRAKGALAAQDERERKAGIKCGLPYEEYGCDWPDATADLIVSLQKDLRFYREKA